jgi:integrase/recombinase XerD
MLIRTEEFNLNGERRVALLFAYKPEITEILSNIEGFSWSHEHSFWHIPYTEKYLDRLNQQYGNRVKFISNTDKCEGYCLTNENLVNSFINYLEINGYCYATSSSYKSHIKRFIRYCDNIPVMEITPEMCRDYIIHFVEVDKLSVTFQGHAVSAIKRFLIDFLGREIDDYFLPRPKRPRQIPIILNEDEVALILRQICDIRDKCMIYLVYSAGLKPGEIVYIKPEHIDTIKMKIYITSAKGDNDRYVILSQKVLILLREYYEIYQPRIWLFENSQGGQINKRLIRQRFHNAVLKSGIKKRVTLTMLKNSFVVHLIERGIDIRYIQKMLGFKHSVSVIRFLKASKREIKEIESPLDRMDV